MDFRISVEAIGFANRLHNPFGADRQGFRQSRVMSAFESRLAALLPHGRPPKKKPPIAYFILSKRFLSCAVAGVTASERTIRPVTKHTRNEMLLDWLAILR